MREEDTDVRKAEKEKDTADKRSGDSLENSRFPEDWVREMQKKVNARNRKLRGKKKAGRKLLEKQQAPRLNFTEEDREKPRLRTAAEKAEQVAECTDQARETLPVKRKLRLAKVLEEAAEGNGISREKAEDESRSGETDLAPEAEEEKVLSDRNFRSDAEAGKTLYGKKRSSRPTILPDGIEASKEAQKAGRIGTEPSSSGRNTEKPIRKQPKRSTSGRKVSLVSEKKTLPPRGGLLSPIPSELVSGKMHQEVSQYEEENAGNAALHRGEQTAEAAARALDHARYSRKLKAYRRTQRLEQAADRFQTEAISPEFPAGAGDGSDAFWGSSNPFSRWQQQRAIRKGYAAGKAGAGHAGASGAADTAAGTGSVWEQAAGVSENMLLKVKAWVQGREKSPVVVFAALFLIGCLLLSQLNSCSLLVSQAVTAFGSVSWPADDREITKADVYYTRLEAELQKRIYRLSQEGDYEEYRFNVGEIGHDPVVLISYLCARYGSFTFEAVQEELDRLFDLQYRLRVQSGTEEQTTTRTVRAGESLGTVVTSAYCNCEICNGQWAGGPTASGVYPTAEHTLAVDANDPIVPMGTEIIMNGILYRVEDTGNFARYGVDFDVYCEDHSTASAWGHQSFEAYLAGEEGEEMEVTVTREVEAGYVTLSSGNLTSLVLDRLEESQKELFQLYRMTGGGRLFLSTPVDGDWHGNVRSSYGYRYSSESGEVEPHSGMDLSLEPGTEVLAAADGVIREVHSGENGSGSLVLETEEGVRLRYVNLSSIRVSAGQAVTAGAVLAVVSSGGNLHLGFEFQGETYHPYFYLETGEGRLGYGEDAELDARAEALIREAEKYLGMPYVWGGSSPETSFDCSGFVSYVINHSGIGLDVGRQTANGLRNLCTEVSRSEARPGDLIFFQGTYDTPGASHVGIYAGNGQMIHCGDPIAYASINTSYWQEHFLSFGRLP